MSFDDAGQLLEEVNALGHVTTFSFDGLGRLTSTTRPDPDGAGPQTSSVTSFTFDAVGNLLSETDALGNVTSRVYDNLYRLTQVLQPDPDDAGPLGRPTTVYTYDAAGNALSLTDPVGNVTSWTYDGLQRVIQETNALSATRSFVYDAANNLVERTDRNGRVTEFDFDHLHRLTEERWLTSAGGSTVRTISYAYNEASELTSASDPTASFTYTFDGLGRATAIDHDLAAFNNVVSLYADFDAASNRTSLKAQIGALWDFATTYTRDNLHRVTKIEQTAWVGGAVADKRVDFYYDPLNRFTSIYRSENLSFFNQVASSDFVYDDAGRLTDLTHEWNTSTLADYGWSYDALDRVTEFVSSTNGTATYSYDATSQVTGATYDYQNDEAHSFDENGNRTASGYSTGTNNRLLSDGTFDYAYDAEGNRVSKTTSATGEVVEYEWDHRNRLTKITEKDSGGTVVETIEYEYDLFDRRTSKTLTVGVGPAPPEDIEHFVHDGEHIVLTFDGDGNLTHRYLHGPAVDQILADEQVATGNVLWPLTDNLGSVREIVDYGVGGTTIAGSIVYDAFGNRVSQTGASILFGYTGRDWDVDAELQYNRARWYDPAVGRWLSQDPIGFEAGDANLYRYVGNGSTNFTDSSGLEGVKVGPDRQSDELSVEDADGNAWTVQPQYDGARLMSGFMDTSGARKRWFSEFSLKVTFTPAIPEQAQFRVKLAAARQVYKADDVGDMGKLFVPVGDKHWSMLVDDYLPRLNARTDFFLGIDPADAERGTIGTIPALNSDDYSHFPDGRHPLDAFDHAWMNFEFSRDQAKGSFSREYAVGAFCEGGEDKTWASVLPFRILLTPNASDPSKFDLAIGVRTPVKESATFNKARKQFQSVISPLRESNERWKRLESWIPGVGY